MCSFQLISKFITRSSNVVKRLDFEKIRETGEFIIDFLFWFPILILTVLLHDTYEKLNYNSFILLWIKVISSWEVTKNVRDRWSSFKNLVVNCPIHPEKTKTTLCFVRCIVSSLLKNWPDKDVEPLDTYEVIKSIALLFREEQPKISCVYFISKFMTEVWVF